MDHQHPLANLKWDEQGLIPAIVQDDESREVLMLAYMNEASLQKTLQTKETWFWSRSRQELWHKGATSGHTQQVTSLRYDCDADALLVLVKPQGPACHKGETTCFHEVIAGETPDSTSEKATEPHILSKLEQIIAERDVERPEGAYTTYLFEQGIDKILKKVGEESAEVIIAAKNNDHEELRNEASDLLYHLLVLLREVKLPLSGVLQILEQRHQPKGSSHAD